MKEVMCNICGKGTNIFRHKDHLLHQIGLTCKKCWGGKI